MLRHIRDSHGNSQMGSFWGQMPKMARKNPETITEPTFEERAIILDLNVVPISQFTPASILKLEHLA